MHTSPVMHVPSAHRTLYKLINRQTDGCSWFTTCIHQNIEIVIIGMTSAAYHYQLQVTMMGLISLTYGSVLHLDLNLQRHETQRISIFFNHFNCSKKVESTHIGD